MGLIMRFWLLLTRVFLFHFAFPSLASVFSTWSVWSCRASSDLAIKILVSWRRFSSCTGWCVVQRGICSRISSRPSLQSAKLIGVPSSANKKSEDLLRQKRCFLLIKYVHLPFSARWRCFASRSLLRLSSILGNSWGWLLLPALCANTAGMHNGTKKRCYPHSTADIGGVRLSCVNWLPSVAASLECFTL